MIAKIEDKRQYGRMGTVGINLLAELDEQPTVMFAHSVQDAVEWAKDFPLYQDAIIDDLGNGSFTVSSQWQPRQKSPFEAAGLIEWETPGMEKAEYTRVQLVITPVNTIYENVGFAGYKHVALREA
jgi:hypothetical protein